MKDISLNNQINPICNNSNISSYNISSISTNKKEENKKMKSPVKKEHLFSFGTDLFYIDNKSDKNMNPSNSVINKSILVGNPFKSNNNMVIKNDRKKNLIERNDNKSKTNSITAKTNRISTNYSGSNSNYNLNKYYESNRPKNGREKINQFEVQTMQEYNIINHKIEDIKNVNYNVQTTLQTLTDSKILELASKYVSQEDDSLDSYRKECLLYNKKNQK
jgi:hypothetical protein